MHSWALTRQSSGTLITALSIVVHSPQSYLVPNGCLLRTYQGLDKHVVRFNLLNTFMKVAAIPISQMRKALKVR